MTTTEDTNQLRPCPFCGKYHPTHMVAPIIGYRGEDGVPINGEWHPVISLQEHGDELTVETWNNRPIEEEWERQYNHRMELDQKEIDALRAEIASLKLQLDLANSDLRDEQI